MLRSPATFTKMATFRAKSSTVSAWNTVAQVPQSGQAAGAKEDAPQEPDKDVVPKHARNLIADDANDTEEEDSGGEPEGGICYLEIRGKTPLQSGFLEGRFCFLH